MPGAVVADEALQNLGAEYVRYARWCVAAADTAERHHCPSSVLGSALEAEAADIDGVRGVSGIDLLLFASTACGPRGDAVDDREGELSLGQVLAYVRLGLG